MRFAVTGATGWLGRAAAEVLAAAMPMEEAADRLRLFSSRERLLALDSGLTLPVAPIEDLPATEFDVLLHYAFVTRELLAHRGLHAYVQSNLGITTTVLSAIAAQRPSAVVMASSGAAVAAAHSGASVAEDPYGALKVIDELALRQASADAGARSMVLRVYNVSGRWLTKPSTFALTDMIMQAIAGGPIVIQATGPVLRSFVDVQDLAEVAIRFASDPNVEDDVVLGTAGERVVEVGQLAQIVAQCVMPADPSIQRTEDPGVPADNYFDPTGSFRALAGDLGVEMLTLEQQVSRTATYMREIGD